MALVGAASALRHNKALVLDEPDKPIPDRERDPDREKRKAVEEALRRLEAHLR